MWSVARRPRWIIALLLALAVAAGFALLGQWQIGRAVQNATVVKYPTEKVVPLARVATPQKEVTDRAAGQMVSLVGRRVAGDTYVVSDRPNFGVTGYWVIGHVVAANGASVALALGWAKTRAEADAAAAVLRAGAPTATIVGRYQPTEPPDQDDFEHNVVSVVSIPWLINEWKVVTPVAYGGYIVDKTAPPGLSTIQSVRPLDNVTLDWLNLFYAIEWAVFAGFAIYLWYRLVRDAWEREEEDREAVDSPATAASKHADVH
ncbi:MAG TPA: SURF1 family cytochrome oxidase biogenesis protein [Galbitalea sp.]|nr:SURF1 family cytochrome oxidase biogenesis protein [Galbitalea sp.]